MLLCWVHKYLQLLYLLLELIPLIIMECPSLSLVIVFILKPVLSGGAVVENLPTNAGDTGSSPGLGRSHMPRSN